MNKTLCCLLFLISLVLFSCSSTKSLTNCPSFKKRTTAKKRVKVQHSKNKPIAKSKKVFAEKKSNRKSKKVDRLANRLVKKIAKQENNTLKTDTLIEKQLHVLFKELKFENPSNKLLTRANDFSKNQDLMPKDRAEEINKIGLVLDSDIKPTSISTNTVHKKKTAKRALKKQARLDNKKIHGLAIAAFICAITGLGIFALIFGAFAVDRIEEEPEKYRGKTLAIIASILGLIGVILAFGFFGILVSAP